MEAHLGRDSGPRRERPTDPGPDGYPDSVGELAAAPAVEAPTQPLAAASDKSIPVRAVSSSRFAHIAAEVYADYLVPWIDRRATIEELATLTELPLEIVRPAITRLALHGAVALAPPLVLDDLEDDG